MLPERTGKQKYVYTCYLRGLKRKYEQEIFSTPIELAQYYQLLEYAFAHYTYHGICNYSRNRDKTRQYSLWSIAADH